MVTRSIAKIKATSFLLASFLTAMVSLHAEAPQGFTNLFNGKNLDGWYGHGTEDPRKLFSKTPEELEKHKAETIKNILQHWKVEDGVIVNDGHGLYLTTDKNYADFDFRVEYKITQNCDSGIYLRGVPQVQIWDTKSPESIKHGADKGSGGLWNNSAGSPGKDPSKLADKPVGEWNSMRIVMIGQRVTVWLNGEEVVSNAVMENYFDRANPIFPSGPIQLQTHGGVTYWRNIYIKELDSAEASAFLKERGEDEGYTTLFNGKDFNGWIGAIDNHEIAQGQGVFRLKPGKGGNLLTKDQYENFSFRFEFRLPKGGNNGVALRVLEPNVDPAWKGFEIQLLDDTDPKYASLKDYQFHGSLYGLVGAKRGFLKPQGEWNCQEVRLENDHLQVFTNNFKTLDVKLGDIDLSKVEKQPEGLKIKKGHVGFAGHSDPVEFRNVRIKSL